MREIADLEFEIHKNEKKCIFLPIEQVGTNICWIKYQNKNVKVSLTLFGWKENILYNVHIVQCHHLRSMLPKILFPPISTIMVNVTQTTPPWNIKSCFLSKQLIPTISVEIVAQNTTLTYPKYQPFLGSVSWDKNGRKWKNTSTTFSALPPPPLLLVLRHFPENRKIN